MSFGLHVHLAICESSNLHFCNWLHVINLTSSCNERLEWSCVEIYYMGTSYPELGLGWCSGLGCDSVTLEFLIVLIWLYHTFFLGHFWLGCISSWGHFLSSCIGEFCICNKEFDYHCTVTALYQHCVGPLRPSRSLQWRVHLMERLTWSTRVLVRLKRLVFTTSQ